MDLLTLKDWSETDIKNIIDSAIKIKKSPEKYSSILKNKTMAMLFEKPSTRTRISFEVAMTQFGGHALFIDWKTTQLAKAGLADEIKCIDRYVDIIMARVNKHETLEIMAKAAKKPVINALSDLYHPCQVLADLVTIKEKLGKLKGLKLAYFGDGNNVCSTLIVACKKVGMNISVACPKGYEPKETPDFLTHNPAEAGKDADIIYTDTWVSMGQEGQKEKRLKAFPPFQVKKLGKAIFMHCLPAYRGYEVTDEVLDSNQSVVFDQAENRLHAQKAVILKLMDKLK